MTGLADVIDELTIPGTLYEKLDEGKVRCLACGHRCVLKPGQRGICKVRVNREGTLYVPWGYVAGAQTDPIEKKPFAHFLPGSDALTFGMVGCNFHCDYCQNWISSQALCDPNAHFSPYNLQQITPRQVVDYAVKTAAQAVVSSYNEPIITTEWAVAIFKLAKEAGLKCGYVSNGYATPEMLEFLRPYLDGLKIDLKTMQADQYRQLGGKLDVVLDTIRQAVEMGVWVEVVTLVIPGFNDTPEELWETSRFLTAVSRDIPWHVTAFHPDYKMTDRGATPAAALQQAAEIGEETGLHYVYAGNLPGRVDSLENTYCPECRQLLVARQGFRISEYHLTAAGKCPNCQAGIAGIWTDKPEKVRLDGWGMPRRARW
ncbi:MAG: AmmeMemoRadiSam system radical SAM enzyme [Anaerolineaceae bacterium]|nr:AmmeMemoRadiSam system radical SAM enzyme [Anaerolineaceae bacterium]